jgi:hypothetical protein
MDHHGLSNAWILSTINETPIQVHNFVLYCNSLIMAVQLKFSLLPKAMLVETRNGASAVCHLSYPYALNISWTGFQTHFAY